MCRLPKCQSRNPLLLKRSKSPECRPLNKNPDLAFPVLFERIGGLAEAVGGGIGIMSPYYPLLPTLQEGNRYHVPLFPPISNRNLKEDFERIAKLVEQRSTLIASWMVANQDASRLISQPPIFRGGKLWTPSHEEIAQVAYRIWFDGGRRVGCEEQDWIQAGRHMGRFD